MNSLSKELSTYRPWLDGLRAVAIIFVFLEHSNKFKSYPLGPIGVGLFFALSGYLISGLLLNELNKNGRINLFSFYMKRFGRLMPGLFLSVFLCSLIFILLHMKRDAFNSIFALTYTANFAAIYYGHHLSGFGHTWSLAVEEHFYIIWPLFMGYIFSRFKLKGLLIGSLVTSLLVIIWRFFLDNIGVNDIVFYLGTVERLDAIMYGCFVMFLLHTGWKPKLVHFMIGFLLILAYAFKQIPYPNVFNSAVMGIGGALIVCSVDSRLLPYLNDFLSNKIMVKLGLLSYSLYLWHLPIFKMVDIFIPPSWFNIFVSILITALVACSSYYFFEMPLRNYFRAKYS